MAVSLGAGGDSPTAVIVALVVVAAVAAILDLGIAARLTPQTLTNLAALAAELDEIHRTGLAVARDELEVGLACVAIPIPDPRGVAAGALCLAGSSDRLDALLAHRDAARECARSLGPLLF